MQICISDVPLVRPIPVILASIRANIYSWYMFVRGKDCRIREVSFAIHSGATIGIGKLSLRVTVPTRCAHLKISVGGRVFYQTSTTTGLKLLANIEEELKQLTATPF